MGAGRKKEKAGSEGIMKKKVRGKKERTEERIPASLSLLE